MTSRKGNEKIAISKKKNPTVDWELLIATFNGGAKHSE